MPHIFGVFSDVIATSSLLQSFRITLLYCFKYSCIVQERDKILHEVSEREERLQRERDAKEKLQKQIQVMNVDALFGFVWQVTLLIRVLVWYLVIFVVFSNIFHGL